jgi:hypothetical protein
LSRGHRPFRALDDAIPIARIRGNVQKAAPGPESQYDFTITGTDPVAFVRVKHAEHIVAVLADIIQDFAEDICRLRMITHDAALSCELWIRSRYGTWRFFRVFAETVVEIGRDGREIKGDTPAS